MSKLTIKIILALISTFFFIILINRLIVKYLVDLPTKEKLESDLYIIFAMLAVIASLVLFAITINYLIVNRIRKLNQATKKVAKGNFDNLLNEKGNDEISNLIHNFNIMINELKQNEYLNKEFVRNVSHEFKTPLSSIKGFAELLVHEDLNSNDAKEYIKIIIQETERLSNLSKNLLQLSMIESSNIIKNNDVFKIDEQIRTILQLTQLEWEAKNIEFDLHLDEIIYEGNKELTYHIWQNLISNAIKFSNHNGKITIKLTKLEGVIFEIIDEGVGIKEDDKDKIFSLFYVADKSRNTYGSGLGLSITKKIVDKLGGSIDFISNLNEGSKFIVKLF